MAKTYGVCIKLLEFENLCMSFKYSFDFNTVLCSQKNKHEIKKEDSQQ